MECSVTRVIESLPHAGFGCGLPEIPSRRGLVPPERGKSNPRASRGEIRRERPQQPATARPNRPVLERYRARKKIFERSDLGGKGNAAARRSSPKVPLPVIRSDAIRHPRAVGAECNAHPTSRRFGATASRWHRRGCRRTFRDMARHGRSSEVGQRRAELSRFRRLTRASRTRRDSSASRVRSRHHERGRGLKRAPAVARRRSAPRPRGRDAGLADARPIRSHIRSRRGPGRNGARRRRGDLWLLADSLAVPPASYRPHSHFAKLEGVRSIPTGTRFLEQRGAESIGSTTGKRSPV